VKNDEDRIIEMKNYMNGNQLNKISTKVVNTSRITPIGKIIRKYSIDELPPID